MSHRTAEPQAPAAETECFELAKLWPAHYGDLRQVARQLVSHRPDDAHSLAATALVNEAYLRLAGDGMRTPLAGRAQFFAQAVRAMRRVLVAHAEARQNRLPSAPATGLAPPHALGQPESDADAVNLLAVHQALKRLATFDERAARVTELKIFGGLEITEIAELLGVSEPTVKRDWLFARTWMAKRLGD